MKETTCPTLKALVLAAMQEKGMKPSQLVQAIGYTNITKGMRRLKTYLDTLAAPSEEFVVSLLSILDINGVAYAKAVTTTLDMMNDRARKNFRPYLQIHLGIRITPVFVACIIQNRCRIPVPEDFKQHPFSEEIDAVIALYQETLESDLFSGESMLRSRVTGFRYHRESHYCLVFDADFALKETAFIQAGPERNLPLGNRLAHLVSARVTA